MLGMMHVKFQNGTEGDMPVVDVILLRRHLPALSLNFILSEEHLKKFQDFVRKEREDWDQIIPPSPITDWQRELLYQINDWPTLHTWMALAQKTNQPELTRILNLRSDEFNELGIVWVDEDEEDDDNGDEDEEDNDNGDVTRGAAPTRAMAGMVTASPASPGISWTRLPPTMMMPLLLWRMAMTCHGTPTMMMNTMEGMQMRKMVAPAATVVATMLKLAAAARSDGIMTCQMIPTIVPTASLVAMKNSSDEGLLIIENSNAYLEHSRRLWSSQDTNFAMQKDKIMAK